MLIILVDILATYRALIAEHYAVFRIAVYLLVMKILQFKLIKIIE